MNPRARHISTIHTLGAVLLASLLLVSCEEVIDLDLDTMDQRIVIEGIVSDMPSASKVKIAFTESIYARSLKKSTSGATVTLRDNLGNSEVLQEVQPGVFAPFGMAGAPNREYTLNVSYGGITYTGVSVMPSAMTLDSVQAWSSGFDFFFGYTTTLTYYLTNKPGVEEFCLIKAFYRNDNTFSWTLYSDKNSDGKQVALEGPSIETTNRTIRVEVLSIDKATYEYFRTLRRIVGEDGIEVPDLLQMNDYNPKSNLSNNALGYFSAQSLRSYTVYLR